MTAIVTSDQLGGFVWAFILLAAAILVIDGVKALRGWIIRRGADYEAERFERVREPRSHVSIVGPVPREPDDWQGWVGFK